MHRQCYKNTLILLQYKQRNLAHKLIHMILLGDCLERLKELPDNSVDSVVTDPPYGLKFMGKKWDYDVPSIAVWREVIRVLKPGGWLLSFGGTRTYHRMVCAIEDAGFEIRDQVQWLYGSGFPKSHDISKGIDKAAGAEREVTGRREGGAGKLMEERPWNQADDYDKTIPITVPATDLAKQWQGWGTALKPANEPIVLARKPLSESTVAKNVIRWGVGGLNIDASRVGYSSESDKAKAGTHGRSEQAGMGTQQYGQLRNGIPSELENNRQGRWPANLLLDETAAEMLDEQSGTRKSGGSIKSPETSTRFKNTHSQAGPQPEWDGYQDSGGASRFFYCAKASKSERSKGLDKHELFKVETGECKDANTAAVQLLQRVISEDIALKKADLSWSIDESGKSISGIFPKECKSITSMVISKTIESQILNLLTRSLTSANTLVVRPLASAHLNPAESVESLKTWLLSITSGEMALALGAVNAASKTLQSISENAEPKDFHNFHSTVKPIKLMEYLIRLITPPGGTVLDPFMGSGSTGVAAYRLGFKFIGCEMSAEYAEIAKKRIEAVAK